MANVYDVANYILNKMSSMTAMKLQKLCYYAQAWSLVWDETPLFANEIQAWENGPVCPDLYQWHRGQFVVNINDDLIRRCDNNLTDTQIDTLNCVIRDYSKFSAQQLSELTHQERPWRETYYRYKDYSGRCNAEIPLALMDEYYSGLVELDVN